MSTLESKPIMAITLNRHLRESERNAIIDSMRDVLADTGYKAVIIEGGTVEFDRTAELLAEQRTTNELLRDILQRMEAIQTATR